LKTELESAPVILGALSKKNFKGPKIRHTRYLKFAQGLSF